MDVDEILIIVGLVAAGGLILLHGRSPPPTNTPSQAVLAEESGDPIASVGSQFSNFAALPYVGSTQASNVMPMTAVQPAAAVSRHGGCSACRG